MPRLSQPACRASAIIPSVRAVIAIVLANLPVRWWGPFEERFPLYAMAWVAGLATMLAGLAIGIPGYLTFMHEAAHGFNAAIGANPDLGIKSSGWGLAALPIYMFATPGGLLATYLGLTGFLRSVSAYLTEDAFGDPLLTGVDAAVRRLSRGTAAYDRRRSREKQEGPEVPDRLVTGRQVGKPAFQFVLLASRAKAEWREGAYLVGDDGTAYRIGRAFDFEAPGGLRTGYPLTELTTGEAIRYAIPYELPPLWRGRKA